MPRFFVDQQPQDGVLTLTGENAHHAGRVLRLRVGEGVTLCDGAGMDFDCTVEAVDMKSLDRYLAGPDVAGYVYITRPLKDYKVPVYNGIAFLTGMKQEEELQKMADAYKIQWNYLMCAAMISSVPTLTVFVVMQKYLIAGMTAGAVKE